MDFKCKSVVLRTSVGYKLNKHTGMQLQWDTTSLPVIVVWQLYACRWCRSSHHAPTNNSKAMSWGWSDNNRLNAENSRGVGGGVWGWEEDVCELLIISWENLYCQINPYSNCYIGTGFVCVCVQFSVGNHHCKSYNVDKVLYMLIICISEFNVWVDLYMSCKVLLGWLPGHCSTYRMAFSM